MKEFIDQVQNGAHLTEEQMMRAMQSIMSGEATEDQIEQFLTALADKGETIDEITGAARIVREKANAIKAPYGAVDCCGTGGDAKGTFNISTAVAITAAACGVPMAKHGNRSVSSKSGAADVLEVLGVNLNASNDVLEYALNHLNFAFLMAPNHHPAMKHVVNVRKRMGRRTIFNLIGPLANPSETRLQLVGVYDKSLVTVFAEVLKKLGTKRAWIVHGSDGLDEITTTGETYIAKLDAEGAITEETLTPEDFGLKQTTLEKLIGGDAERNAKALRAVLEGQKCSYRDIILANTAAVLCIHGSAETLEQGVEMAANALDNDEANTLLKDYISTSRKRIGELEAA